MKKIKQPFLIALLCVGFGTVKSQDIFENMLIAQRDSILTSIAKEVVLMYAPDYYRDKFPPKIARAVVPPFSGPIHPSQENLVGKVLYAVTFLYDPTEERLAGDFAVSVSIWGSTGNPRAVTFTDSWFLIISRNDDNYDWCNATPNPRPYHESIIPLYDINNPDPNQEPVNKDELLRRGWKRKDNGQWERTRPDAPPAEAQRAIRRAQDDMRRRNAERERNRGGEENRD